MKITRRLVWAIVLVVGIAALLFFFFAPTNRVRSLVNSYNRWTNPRPPTGRFGGLIGFLFQGGYGTYRLKKIVSPDCDVSTTYSDGRVISLKGNDFVSSFASFRFVFATERVFLKRPVVRKEGNHYLAQMKYALCEGHAVNMVELELVIENSDKGFLIKKIKETHHEPTDEELNKVFRIKTKGFFSSEQALLCLTPSFSPNGKSLVFCARNPMKTDIYMMNPNGSHLTPLTDTEYNENNPIFTPDGKSILFFGDKDNHATEPYLIDQDGSNYRRLIPNIKGVCEVQYSPDGTHIALTVQKGTIRRLYIMDSNNQNIKCLKESKSFGKIYSLVFSPDSNKIFFSEQWNEYNKKPPRCVEIFSINVDGTKLQQLTKNRLKKRLVGVTPSHVLYLLTLGEQQDYKAQLSWMTLDGSFQECLISGYRGINGGIKVLPDYKHVTFIDDRGKQFRYQLFLAELKRNGKSKQLTNENKTKIVRNPRISPDGKNIAYSNVGMGRPGKGLHEIRIISLNTNEIKTIWRK